MTYVSVTAVALGGQSVASGGNAAWAETAPSSMEPESKSLLVIRHITFNSLMGTTEEVLGQRCDRQAN